MLTSIELAILRCDKACKNYSMNIGKMKMKR